MRMVHRVLLFSLLFSHKRLIYCSGVNVPPPGKEMVFPLSQELDGWEAL